MSPGIAVAVIPEEYYHKPRGVQFKKRFRKRADAVTYAEQHNCRVVIACEGERRYDVLCDPDSIPGPKARFELVVDRGEMVAVHRPAGPQCKVREPRVEPDSEPTQPSLKIAWHFMHSWLSV